jgi:hypothetical protein
MTNSRISAKAARSIADKAKQDLAQKKSAKKLLEKKLKRVFQEIVIAAIDGEKGFEYSDEDKDFLKYCCNEFHKIGLIVELNFSDNSSELMDVQENKINELMEKIEFIGEKTTKKIGSVAEKFYEFLMPHPEYVVTYEWLLEVYNRSPLIQPDWYRCYFQWKSLDIVSAAEYENIFDDKNLKYEWQNKIKIFIEEIKTVYEASAPEIQALWERVIELEGEEIIDDINLLFDPECEYEWVDVLSISLSWYFNQQTRYFSLDDHLFFSSNALQWISSDFGQNFLKYVDSKILSSSNEGENEISLRLVYEGDELFYLFDEIEKLPSPPPEPLVQIYILLGFKAKVMTNTTNTQLAGCDFIFIKIGW